MSASVFNIPSSSSPATPKVHFTHAQLSAKYLDPTQPPTKAVPFRQIRNVQLVKDVKLCMPEWAWRALHNEDGDGDGDPHGAAVSGLPELRYAKVAMTLKDVLENEDLRRGTYLLLSKTNNTSSSSSTTISLKSGTLTIDMPHHIHQQSGLISNSSTSSKPSTKIPSGGRKQDPKSARYRVEMDLRQPSMVRGKKGFDRLMYAAKNVDGLRERRVWLFYDLGADGKGVAGNGGGKKRKRGEEGSSHSKDQPLTSTTATASELTTSVSQNDRSAITTTDTGTTHPLSSYEASMTSTPPQAHTSPPILTPHFLTNPTFFSILSSRITKSNSSKRGSLPTILEDDIHEVIEYLSLLFLESPRITRGGYGPEKVDPYLCQYTLPEIPISTDALPRTEADIADVRFQDSSRRMESNDEPELPVEDIRYVAYSGFMGSSFVTQLLVDIIRRSRSRSKLIRSKQIPDNRGLWIAIQVTAHKTDVRGGTDGYMILLQGDAFSDGSVESTSEAEKGPEHMEMTVDDERTNGNESIQKEEMGGEIKDGNDGSNEQTTHGFRYATCFEFVDSLVG